jgi:hypothetical protein
VFRLDCTARAVEATAKLIEHARGFARKSCQITHLRNARFTKRGGLRLHRNILRSKASSLPFWHRSTTARDSGDCHLARL